MPIFTPSGSMTAPSVNQPTEDQTFGKCHAMFEYPASISTLERPSDFNRGSPGGRFSNHKISHKGISDFNIVRQSMSTKTLTASDAPCLVNTTKLANRGATTHSTPSQLESTKPTDVQVRLQYLEDNPLYETVKPLQIVPDWADTEGKTNVKLVPGPTETIHDVRRREHEFSLDTNGFRYIKAPTTFKDWSSQPKIAREYLPELEAVIRREVEGCDEILFYDARLRQESEEGVKVQGLSYKPFARQVHRDNTDSSVITKIRNLTEMKADYLLSGRARIINIWRPIKHPVYDCALAVADAATLQEGDIIEVDRVRKDTGEFWDTMGVARFRPGFEWFYMSEQNEEDVLLFKNFDSADVNARHCLHTAFDIPAERIPPNAPTRESIEVRCLIFTYPATGRRPSGRVPHPLVTSLEQGRLKYLDDEPNITDRQPTDIDEWREIKDAMLLLRRRTIQDLERVRDELLDERDRLDSDLIRANSERDRARTALEHIQKQVSIQTSQIESLQSEVQHARQELQRSQPDLRRQVHQLSAQLNDARLQPRTRIEANGAHGVQNDLLLHTVQRQQQEIEKWKAEAMGRGNQAVSTCFQASVDDSVRREREKDGLLIQTLREQIEQLKSNSIKGGP